MFWNTDKSKYFGNINTFKNNTPEFPFQEDISVIALHSIMKIKTIIFLIIILALWSCDTIPADNNPEAVIIDTPKWTMPYIVDTFNFRTAIRNQKEFGIANYLPLYFGKLDDTLFVNYFIKNIPPPPDPYLVYQDSNGNTITKKYDKFKDHRNDYYWDRHDEYFPLHSSEILALWDSIPIDIHIDTTQTIRNIDFSASQDSTYAFMAYPVVLSNNTDKKIRLGYGPHIELILEAKDKKGQWNPIERDYTYFCGTGLPVVVLPAGESVITSVKMYQGDFKTDLRLRTGNSLSETFQGSIYLTQFRKE